MIRSTYEIKIRGNATCPAKDKVNEIVGDLEEGKSALIKSVIGTEKVTDKWPVFIDDAANGDNQYGYVISIKNDKEELDDMDIQMLAQEGNYEILLNDLTGKTLSGVFNILTEEGAAHKSSDAALVAELKAAADKAVEDGFVTREEMDKRLAFMAENHVDEYLQLRIVKRYRNYNKPSHVPSCLFQDPYLEASIKRKQEGIISEGLRAVASRSAVICEGEKSVGKNVYLETIAWLCNMPMYLITFSRQMSPSSVYGEKTTDNSAAKALAEFDSDILAKADVVEEKRKFMFNFCCKQKMEADEATKYVDASLSEEDKKTLKDAAKFRMLQAQSASVNIIIDQSELYDWLVDGGIMCFNEMNMAEANFFASFTNQLLDGTGFLFVPGRGEVPIHKDCMLFGTQNADYQGVETQNEATMSRFGCIVFPQPESIKKQLVAASEAAIAKGDSPEAKLDSKYYTECQRFYAQCRAAVNKGAVTNACLNIRGFVRALTAVAESNGYARLKRQIQIHVINTCPTDDRMALNATLEQLVTL